MLLSEPAPTPADLRFRLFGFPVRINPFFWLVSLILATGGGKLEPSRAFVWVAVVLVSILIHELGHAFVQRYFGGRPWIVLHGIGGLAICDDCDRSPRSQILISLAGPAAGFIFAIVVAGVLFATGHRIGLTLRGGEPNWEWLGSEYAEVLPMILFDLYFAPYTSNLANQLASALLQVNVLWGLVNLLPVYPLDGGRVARELFTLGDPRRGIVQSLQLSIGAAVLVAVFALTQRSMFTAIMFGLLAVGSYQALAAYRNHWR
jgi:Zn-dependent protease